MPNHYWGEVDRAQALEMIAAARRESWVEAVCARFPPGDNMRFGLLDLQRASWAPMLGLNAKSVVADIGSGYGCITHSLSRFAKEVYSVEAVTERIEFTQERLRQEGISNVHLVQASATSLPLLDNSFDAVVVNGVLEWVGEWELSLDPRAVQLNFLQKIRRMLKDNGVLLVGIENRIGLGLLLGGRDHSGMPYTSLVPRRVASFMLRHRTDSHYRTQLNAKREYRTYTYSKRGYRKLLGDAGFPEVVFYWSDPGYNQPYCLIPLAVSKWVQRHFIRTIEHPSPAPRRSWRRRLKRIAAPLLPPFVPEFILLASKRPGRQTELQTWIEGCLSESQPLAWELHTVPFKAKSIVRLGREATASDVAYLKIFTGNQADASDFETERVNRAKVGKALQASSTRLVKVPRFYGTQRTGNTVYYLESASKGEAISSIVRRLGYFENTRRVAQDFHQICDRILELTSALQQISDAPLISPSWLEISEELRSRPELLESIEQNRYFAHAHRGTRPAWVQHGDLSVENMHLIRATGELEIFDWSDLARGFSPLYDLLEFFVSIAYLPRAQETLRFESKQERWMASFRALFFSESSFGALASDLIRHACEHLGVSPGQFPSLLLEFLILRCRYYGPTSLQHRVHLQALETCIESLPWLREKWG
ncbi:MAG TPA: class I SAM-dependent methyltransferase [Candidatus Sulfotelmatobacter sp.]|nr:class I SAM-dependent methyltransferase [Candidatus Sulfotelmatobacter sp.]